MRGLSLSIGGEKRG